MGDAPQQTRSIPAWLNKDLIQKILREGYEDPNITVESYDVTYALKAGEGYLSDMYRVIAQLNNSKDRRVIIKCHPKGGHREEMVTDLDAFSKEIRMLSETLPAMYKFLQDACSGQFQAFFPKCLYHGDCPVTYLVMEDLREQGFTLVDRAQGLDLRHCILAMKTLARFHASSVPLHESNPAAVESYECPASDKTRRHGGQFFESALKSFVNEVSKWPGYERYVGKLRKLQGTVYDRVIKVHKVNRDELNVLNHGDLWTSNMMFRYSGNTVEDIRFVDFQISHFGPPVLDLLYFFYTCLSEEVRINYMDSLIAEYHNTLNGTLSVLGYSQYNVSLEKFQRIIIDRGFYGFITAVSVMPIAMANSNSAYDLEGSLSDNGESEDSNAKLYSNKGYVEAMKRLLPLFDKEGHLD